MSLVNNMLRDLDQRRKESDSSGGSVKLMPARDYIKSEQKNLLPFVLVGLVALAAALAFYWVQLSQSSTEQQLDMRVQPMASNSAIDSQRLIEELEASIVEAEIQEERVENAQIELVNTQTEPVVPGTVSNSPVTQVQNDSPSAELPIAPITREEPTVAEVSDTTQAEEIVAADPRLVRDAPKESVKEAPEFSNEQLDTIAVQTALRQLSDGQTAAAYQTLEDYISENRFAHQSRETYAKLLMSSGRVVDANALIDAGLMIAPNHSGFKKVKARLLMANGQLREAVDILMSRAPTVAADSEYHDLLASAQLSSRDFAGAIISYSSLVQTDETQGKWWYGFAAAHDQLGNSQPARQAYARAMQFDNLSANLRRRSQERIGALSP
jgi:MSHA biogenesis protein MshN